MFKVKRNFETPYYCNECNDGELNEDCQDCCTHSSIEHFQCIDCGKEFDPGIFIDRAERDFDR